MADNWLERRQAEYEARKLEKARAKSLAWKKRLAAYKASLKKDSH